MVRYKSLRRILVVTAILVVLFELFLVTQFNGVNHLFWHVSPPILLIPNSPSKLTSEQEIIKLLQCPSLQSTDNGDISNGVQLYCSIAQQQDEEAKWFDTRCPAATRTQLLRLWKTLRDAVQDDSILKLGLSVAQPISYSIAKHSNLKIWAPKDDQGVAQVIRELSQRDYGDFFPLLTSPDSLFLDGGSNLGFVTLLTALETNATIVSFEAASPTWIMQQLNLVCNLSEIRLHSVHSQLAALGSKDGDSIQLQWRQESTITVRGWDAPPSFVHSTVNCLVPVRTVRSVLKDIFGSSTPMIDVFKMDCEGCEYNVIPDLSEEDMNKIGTMIGEIHYGFIPTAHAPSSERSKKTHQRLCQYENFVKIAKECCAFPNQRVKHLNVTVGQVPGNDALCHDFKQWSANNKLFEIPDDSGWLHHG